MGSSVLPGVFTKNSTWSALTVLTVPAVIVRIPLMNSPSGGEMISTSLASSPSTPLLVTSTLVPSWFSWSATPSPSTSTSTTTLMLALPLKMSVPPRNWTSVNSMVKSTPSWAAPTTVGGVPVASSGVKMTHSWFGVSSSSSQTVVGIELKAALPTVVSHITGMARVEPTSYSKFLNAEVQSMNSVAPSRSRSFRLKLATPVLPTGMTRS